mmetsp:Transcript_17259/g.49299  ORF Transcript_17259/g.49299 Transcript_17259/m.49299 type:complete len:319 (+) Transcript_17259:177-1133(+)
MRKWRRSRSSTRPRHRSCKSSRRPPLRRCGTVTSRHSPMVWTSSRPWSRRSCRRTRRQPKAGRTKWPPSSRPRWPPSAAPPLCARQRSAAWTMTTTSLNPRRRALRRPWRRTQGRRRRGAARGRWHGRHPRWTFPRPPSSHHRPSAAEVLGAAAVAGAGVAGVRPWLLPQRRRPCSRRKMRQVPACSHGSCPSRPTGQRGRPPLTPRRTGATRPCPAPMTSSRTCTHPAARPTIPWTSARRQAWRRSRPSRSRRTPVLRRRRLAPEEAEAAAEAEAEAPARRVQSRTLRMRPKERRLARRRMQARLTGVESRHPSAGG